MRQLTNHLRRKTMKNKLTPAEKSRIYRKNNPEKVKVYNKMRYERDIDKIKAYQTKFRDELRFSGQSEEVFERDGWECRECGMSQEQSIILFNRRLYIHHIDENGSGVIPEKRNHQMDNLITLCSRCHGRIHRDLHLIDKWGDLLEQDESEWRFPKIRKLVQEKARGSKITLQNAERVVGKMFGVSRWTIDGMYYDRRKELTKLIPKTK